MGKEKIISEDTIIAVSTPKGCGGIAVIRISGDKAVEIADSAWKGKRLADMASHSAHLGKILNSNGEIIDEVVATIFRAPNSFTGEDTIEISCHGSLWIQRELVNEFIRRGCRPARGGEFSQRAFINGRIDLTKAEAIADLIAASSRSAHRIAMNQMRGDFSNKLSDLRRQLLDFVSLIELELDFSEEDVEFADRSNLIALSSNIKETLDTLSGSFAVGSAIKDGVPVAIVGATNVGKSTLLNRLLHEEKAIVSDIHGTTRDIVEDTIEIEGILFRFIDTAGIRQTDDVVENLGIQRTHDRIKKAEIVVWIIDPTENLPLQLSNLDQQQLRPEQNLIIVVNKHDIYPDIAIDSYPNAIHISAKTGYGVDKLITSLTSSYSQHTAQNDVIITNARHYDALCKASQAIGRCINALSDGISGDFIAQDIRECMHYLAEITGEISTDDLLGNIFANFCIGK